MTCLIFFFLNAPATTTINTLSLHDALPIYVKLLPMKGKRKANGHKETRGKQAFTRNIAERQENHPHVSLRSEEHTSELQSRGHLVCRLLLEKKNKKYN